MNEQHTATNRDVQTSKLSRLQELISPTRIQLGDNIGARLTAIDNAPCDSRVVVTRISPLGMEFSSTGFPGSFQKGSTVDINLSIGNESASYRGLVVDDVAEYGPDQLVTIRLVQPNEQRQPGSERRHAARWLCSEQFYPTAIATNPARYNDFLYLTIRDLSRDGARLTTSLRNKFIVSGMTLDCLVSFPLVAQIRLAIKVRNVTISHENGKDVLSVGVEFSSPAQRDLSVIAQYLLQFGDADSLEELRAQGLNPTSVGKAVDYSFVRTKEEYDQVLSLRAEAYREAGKVPQSMTSADMADPFDAKARIVIGKYRGKVVASARMYLPQYGDMLEQEQYVTWPKHFGRRDEIVEIMRVCTHSQFRSSDLLFSLFRFIAISAIQSKRYIIAGCATDVLLPLYTKIGFRDTKLKYDWPALNNLSHTLLVGDAKRSILGLDVGPVVWNVIWRDTIEYLVENQFITLDTPTRFRLMLYRSMSPLAFWLRRRARRPRRATNR